MKDLEGRDSPLPGEWGVGAYCIVRPLDAANVRQSDRVLDA